MKIKLSIGLILIVISVTGCSGFIKQFNTLQMLVKLGQNNKLKENLLKQETINFKQIKSMLEKNELKKGGATKSEIESFCKPVLIVSEVEGEKWIYKPGSSNWIGGEKIYLFFDTNGCLIDWEFIREKLS